MSLLNLTFHDSIESHVNRKQKQKTILQVWVKFKLTMELRWQVIYPSISPTNSGLAWALCIFQKEKDKEPSWVFYLPINKLPLFSHCHMLETNFLKWFIFPHSPAVIFLLCSRLFLALNIKYNIFLLQVEISIFIKSHFKRTSKLQCKQKHTLLFF